MVGWTIFLDADNDGIRDLTEPQTLTDASGYYSFSAVQSGNHRVTEVLQPGWEPADGFDAAQNVTVFTGGVTVVDFYNLTPEAGSVSGTLWNDLDGNGSQSLAEPGLGGWQVYVDANSNGAFDDGELTAISDAMGNYTVFGVSYGSSTIREVIQDGWLATTPTGGARTIYLLNGTNLDGVDFGNRERQEASISGTVFADTNKNGLRDPGERGLEGITVYLDLNHNGALDVDEPSTVSSADLFYTPSVDETGNYQFTHLARGTYYVREIVPPTLSATPLAVLEQVVSLGPVDHTGIDFADVFRPNEIHGVVFDDLDRDHIHDPDEPGRAGITVYIDLDRDDIFDASEMSTVTDADGSYEFLDLSPGAYVVRELVDVDREITYPTTTGGVLWPLGASNPSVGNVSPSSITASLAEGETYRQTVSLTLPNSGAVTNLVDVFLLFDDTGSFTANSPIVRAAFPTIISTLQASLPGIDLGFGVGRLEEYGNFADEYATGRPFILNQPIIAADTPGFSAAIQAALDRMAPGYGGDQPETDIEALYQLVTGLGFDGNNNGSVLDSGPAGLASTQLNPGSSGDVPDFSSFTADPANNVLPASGNIGGGGFRSGALPVILLATDTGFAYQPMGDTSITGVGGLTLPLAELTQLSRPTTPFDSGAGIQETITGLNALGALVIGLGTNQESTLDPRQMLESLAMLTGAVNNSMTTIENGTTDSIAPGDPLYFQISSGFGSTVANGVINAIQNAVTNVAVDITLKASDPRVRIINHTGTITGVGAGQTATFDVEFVGDGVPHRFDLQFVRAGTNVVLGSIPVVLGTPIPGDGYEFEDLEEGEIELEVEFGDSSRSIVENQAPVLSVSGPLDGFLGVRGQTRTFGLTVSDDAPPELDPQFTYEINWGDGSPLETLSGAATFNASHSFASAGVYDATFRAIDAGGLSSTEISLPLTILTSELQGNVLAWGGTSGDDLIAITPSAVPQQITLTLNSIGQGTFTVPDGGLAIYGGAGIDTLALNGTNLDESFTATESSLAWSGSGAWVSGFGAVTNDVERRQIAALAGNDAITVISGLVEVDGGAGSDSLSGPNIVNSWQVTASNTGSLNGQSFSRIEQLIGGAVADTFAFVGTGTLSGTISGGDGDDRIDYSARTAAVTVNWSTFSTTGTTGWSSIERFTGSSAATDKLIGPAGTNNWKILPGTDDSVLNDAAFFRGFETINAGAGSDTFVIEPGVVDGPAINAGTGADSLDYSGRSEDVTINLQAKTATGLSQITGFESYLAGSGTNTMIGADAANTWTIQGLDTGKLGSATWSHFQNLIGGSMSDSFKFTSAGNLSGTIDGAAGVDTVTGQNVASTWNLTGVNAGTLNDIAFANIENLKGGTAADEFVFNGLSSISGNINGGTGKDQLNYAAATDSVTVNLQSRTADYLGTFSSIESLVGSSSADTLIGPSTKSTWTIKVADGGTLGTTSFSSFESLVGGSLDDIFKFTGVGALSGGIDGGAGINTIDYSSLASSIVVDLSLGTAERTAGVSNIQNIYGGSGHDTLIGSFADNLIRGNGGNDTIDGGTGGNDILVGGNGSDTISSGPFRSILIGGGGRDELHGGGNQDILIASATRYDTNITALNALMLEWKRTDLSYNERIDHLTGAVPGGLNVSTLLTSATVVADNTLDQVAGHAELDWFWADFPELLDLELGEILN